MRYFRYETEECDRKKYSGKKNGWKSIWKCFKRNILHEDSSENDIKNLTLD